MKIACWNIRGFNKPLKQNGVKSFIKKHQVDVMGVLETKLNLDKLARVLKNKFQGWVQINNFDTHAAGRILLLWNPMTVDVQPLDISPQIIHCCVKCKVTSSCFYLSFVYGLHSVISRRQLWSNISSFAQQCVGPWTLLGDFNCVLNDSEKVNGRPVTDYEIKDFVDCCTLSGLSDLPSAGCFFTWTNNTISSKLDRVLVNNRWHCDGLIGQANFLPSGCLSDHSPCLVSLLQQAVAPKQSFKFFNMWADHELFIPVVRMVWDQNFDGSSQFILCRKLKALKSHLRVLNKNHFGHISVRAVQANKELEEGQLSLQMQPRNEELQRSVAVLRKKANFLLEAERLFYWQKAKCTYLKLSDRSSKFFHDLVKRNFRRNFIPMVIKANGEPTSSNDQVVEEFVRYYQALLGTSSLCEPIDFDVIRSGPLVSVQQCAMLIGVISDQEIKAALFDIGEDKAPGPDGYSSCFFKRSWSIVGPLFCKAVKEFFSSKCLLKQVNHSALVLIPKSSHAQAVADFRPISCCNVFYKVISKILAARMSTVLGSLIDHAQAAFVEGRSLSDNVHLVQELLRKYSRKRISPRCLIKVDLCKAYDSLNWSFINQVLLGIGFPPLFVDWIMECISSPYYSIIVNGGMCGFFKGAKGLRQGDPISPFIFVVCLEYLSRALNCATMNSEFNFHPKCAKLKISHLAFADDIMLMSRGDPISVRILMECLSDFGAKSGLAANVSKSNLFSAGIQGQDLRDILQITGFEQGKMPFRYLGIPLAAQKLNASSYAPLIDSISKKISSWTASSLSYAGRSELIQAVLQGTACFWLSILNVPFSVIDSICRLCRIFLWNSKLSLVPWKDICLPKNEGGLGLKDLRSWNSSLLSKVLWNIHNKKDSLWIKWVSNEYLISGSIWERDFRKDDSPIFKKLLAIRNSLMSEGSPGEAMNILSGWVVNGTFSTKVAYNYFRPKGRRPGWDPVIWKSNLIPKQAFILWLCARGKLLTKDRLLFLDIDQACSLCRSAPETLTHLMFQCSVSSAVWNKIRGWLGISRAMSTINSAFKWMKCEARGSSWPSRVKKMALAVTVYEIWNVRNRAVFEGLKPCVETIICRIKTFVYKAIFTLYPNVLVQYESIAALNQ